VADGRRGDHKALRVHSRMQVLCKARKPIRYCEGPGITPFTTAIRKMPARRIHISKFCGGSLAKARTDRRTGCSRTRLIDRNGDDRSR